LGRKAPIERAPYAWRRITCYIGYGYGYGYRYRSYDPAGRAASTGNPGIVVAADLTE
jgi:hypothetical protein